MVDTLFERHSVILQSHCQEAHGLTATLFGGVAWRSRVTENERLRVYDYAMHMRMDQPGVFSMATE